MKSTITLRSSELNKHVVSKINDACALIIVTCFISVFFL